jgi:hypothetical protein
MGLIFWGRYGEEKICHSYRVSKNDFSVVHPVVSSLCEVNTVYAQRDIIMFLRFVHRFPKTKYAVFFTHRHFLSRLPFYCMTCIKNTLRLAPVVSGSGAQHSTSLLTTVSSQYGLAQQ